MCLFVDALFGSDFPGSHGKAASIAKQVAGVAVAAEAVVAVAPADRPRVESEAPMVKQHAAAIRVGEKIAAADVTGDL